MLQIGVTGSRYGPATSAQASTFYYQFTALFNDQEAILHHGDCIGWDAHCHQVARSLGLDIIVHPPDKSEFRAFCEDASYVHPVKPYFERNRDICVSTSVLIGMPSTAMHEKKRGGTWYTIRYARAIQRRVIVILPDGTLL